MNIAGSLVLARFIRVSAATIAPEHVTVKRLSPAMRISISAYSACHQEQETTATFPGYRCTCANANHKVS